MKYNTRAVLRIAPNGQHSGLLIVAEHITQSIWSQSGAAGHVVSSILMEPLLRIFHCTLCSCNVTCVGKNWVDIVDITRFACVNVASMSRVWFCSIFHKSLFINEKKRFVSGVMRHRNYLSNLTMSEQRGSVIRSDEPCWEHSSCISKNIWGSKKDCINSCKTKTIRILQQPL